MDVGEKRGRIGRPRGRPAGKKSIPTVKKIQPEPLNQGTRNGSVPEELSVQQEDETADSLDASQTGYAGSFSVLLGFLLKNDRSEVLRIAREIGVTDNTVYRWLNGTSEPRYSHMQRLLEVLSQSQSRLALPVFPAQPAHHGGGRNTGAQAGRWDVQKETYRRVLEQLATTVDDASRRWHIIETIFEQALLHLDADRHGMALTYARLMPPRADGNIHSLYEAEMRGQTPWPFTLEFKTYLGSTTLAGAAAMFQRVQTWSNKEEGKRIPVGLDENERSSCAAPVMRGGRLAGVLIVSSALDDFVRDPAIPRAVGDYAHLLAAGLMDEDFSPVSLVRLVPMPDLPWQREKISRSYLNRVIEYSRKQCLSFPEAEQKVLVDLESEFERYASAQNDGIGSQQQARAEIEQLY